MHERRSSESAAIASPSHEFGPCRLARIVWWPGLVRMQHSERCQTARLPQPSRRKRLDGLQASHSLRELATRGSTAELQAASTIALTARALVQQRRPTSRSEDRPAAEGTPDASQPGPAGLGRVGGEFVVRSTTRNSRTVKVGAQGKCGDLAFLSKRRIHDLNLPASDPVAASRECLAPDQADGGRTVFVKPAT